MAQAKSAIEDRLAEDMRAMPVMPDWSARQKLALACRILAREGHESGLAGQLTLRGEAPGTFWTLPFGQGFDEASASSLVLFDEEMQLLEGEVIPNPGVRFHLWIYRARPALRCIVHTHPPAAAALSMIGEPLIPAHMDSTMFYEDCAYLPEWPGVPIADDEGRIISEALGDKRAILLAHHGQLVVSDRIEEASYLAVAIERAARRQLDARAAGTIRPIEPALGREAHDFMLKPEIVDATFHYHARRVLKESADCLD